MKNIIKSYLKTFFQKNFVTTFGILFFIILLSTVIIGMLSTPLQLNTKINQQSKTNLKYNFLIRSQNMTYSPEFNYQYFYLNKDLDHETKNTKIKSVLSEHYIKAVNSQVAKNFKEISAKKEHDRYLLDFNKAQDIPIINFISSLIRDDLIKYRTGALIKSSASIIASEQEKKDILKNTTNKIIDRTKTEIEQKIATDAKKFKDLKFTSFISEIYKAYAKVDNFLITNGVKSIDKNQIRSIAQQAVEIYKQNDYNGLVKFIFEKTKTVLEQIREERSEIYLPTFDMFSVEFENHILSKNHHDDRIYLINKILENQPNYAVQINKTFVLKEQEAGQILPKKILQLTSDNHHLNQQFNQVQFDKNYEDSHFTNTWISNFDYDSTKPKPEIIITSSFARDNNLEINDTFLIPNSNIGDIFLQTIDKKDAFYLGPIQAKIVGIGSTFDDIASKISLNDFFQSKSSFLYGYANQEFINQLRESRWSFASQKDSGYGVEIRVKDQNDYDISNLSKVFSNVKLKNATVGQPTTVSFFDRSFSPFIEWTFSRVAKGINNIRIQVIIYMILGFVVLVLAFIFINFALRKEMNETRRQLGIFKSFGYKVAELSWIFALKTWITITLGIVIGYLLSTPIQIYAASNFTNAVTFTFKSVYVSPLLFINLFILIPAVFLLLSYALTILYIREPVLSLMNNAKKAKRKVKSGWFTDLLSKRNIGFGYRMRLSFIKTSKGKFAIIQIIFVFSSLAYALLFGAQTILNQSINQSLAEIKADVDHRTVWKNNKSIDISTLNGKYSFIKNNTDDRTELTYHDLSNKNPNEWLNQTDGQNDMRYRVELLLKLISNSYHKTSNMRDKLSMFVPQKYAVKRLSPLIGQNKQPDKPEDYSVLKDEKNYFLTLIARFNLLNDSEWWKTALDQIKANRKVDIDNSKISTELFDISANANRQDEMSKTVAGLQAKTSDSKNPNSSIFLSSIAKTFSYKLAQAYSLYQIYLDYKNSSDQNNFSIEKSWEKLLSDEALKEFDPTNQKYWSITDNPLIEEITKKIVLSSSSSDQSSTSVTPTSINSLIGASNLSNANQNVLMLSLILQEMQSNYVNDPVITFNQMLYDKKTDLLSSSVLANFVKDSGLLRLNLYDFNSPNSANVSDFLNFEDITEQQFSSLKDKLQFNNSPMFNVIVPYYYAKANNIGLSSKIALQTKTSVARKFYLNVIGINKSITLSLVRTPEFVLDYKTFADVMFNKDLYDNQPKYFNTLWSKHKLIEGEFDFKDQDNPFKYIKYYGQNIALDVQPSSPVFLSLFSNVFDEFNDLIGVYKPVDSQIDIYNTANPTSDKNSRLGSEVIPFNLGKQGIKRVLKVTNQIMIIFILLITFLLTIILVVVMNIVVGESKKTILVLRAIGYKDIEVNWIVMGSYVIGAFICFIFAYSLSNVIWLSFLYYVSNKWQIYIFLPFDIKNLIITFSIISLVLFIGWFFSNKQVKQTPLTQATQAE
ncbi:FtsX-like permease family protein [Mycoplasma putrefaciens]|uniref:FtsX-like permease family protein n=1 Tax=Mycoplasma putrefaciens TaxID=2123 RepID=UPI003DA1D23C